MVNKDDINHLPIKDEFYNKMDEVMGELKTIREEQTLISHRVSDHKDRIEKIESHLDQFVMPFGVSVIKRDEPHRD